MYQQCVTCVHIYTHEKRMYIHILLEYTNLSTNKYQICRAGVGLARIRVSSRSRRRLTTRRSCTRFLSLFVINKFPIYDLRRNMEIRIDVFLLLFLCVSVCVGNENLYQKTNTHEKAAGVRIP